MSGRYRISEKRIFELREFLMDLFIPEELKAFVSVYAPTIAPWLPGNNRTPMEFVGEVLGLLCRHGCIDKGFFRALRKERPRRRDEIRKFKRRCLRPPD